MEGLVTSNIFTPVYNVSNHGKSVGLTRNKKEALAWKKEIEDASWTQALDGFGRPHTVNTARVSVCNTGLVMVLFPEKKEQREHALKSTATHPRSRKGKTAQDRARRKLLPSQVHTRAYYT